MESHLGQRHIASAGTIHEVREKIQRTNDATLMKLAILDMGNTQYGDCLLLQNNGATVLIDGGHSSDYESWRRERPGHGARQFDPKLMKIASSGERPED